MEDPVLYYGAGFPPGSDQRYCGIGIKRQAKTAAQARVSEIKPINIRLQDKDAYLQPVLRPRRYQEELYLKALEGNIIIYLGTGLGKTFITVLLLNSPHVDELICKGRKVAFLAPTQDLVKQQAEYVVGKVPYKVRVYCGRTTNLGIHIDLWNENHWNAELDQIDILFMTPQIFSSAISTGYLKWEKFSAVIFDEVHHAATSKKEKDGKGCGHPYSQALRHYKALHSQKAIQPRFIGLTASLINNMPKSVDCIRNGIKDLEVKLSAKCVTDLTAIETKPMMVIYSYTKPNLSRQNDVLMDIFYKYSQLLSDSVAASKEERISALGPKTDEEKEIVSYLNRLKLASSGISIKPASFHKVFKQLAAIRANSGLWTLANICYNLHSAVEKHSVSSVLSEEIKPMYVDFAAVLKKIFLAINSFLGLKPQSYLLEYSQPKLNGLLALLSHEYNRVLEGNSKQSTFSCIVFVQSRVEVFAVCGWLQQVSESVPGYEFLKVDYAIGLAATMTSKWSCITKRKAAEQGAMLDNFRRGKLNVIVTTSVLEEGIDLPVCSTVIRYDPAKTFRIYVQSRGRARQVASSFVAMCESDKRDETKSALNKFNDFEERVKDFLRNDSSRPYSGSDSATNRSSVNDRDDDGDFFTDVERGIRLDANMAKIILHMYCSRLAKRCPYSDGLTYDREETEDKLFRTTLFFPPGCPIKDSVRGRARPSIGLADNSAIVAAYRALYEAGELDEHGVPVRATEEHVDTILAKYNLKPDFQPLERSLEGEIKKIGERELHVFPWKLCQLNTCLLRDFSMRTYKLYRINFKAASDDVRQDTRQFFERQTLGLIVDSARDPASWPSKLYSHYGEFLVEYELIDADLKFETYTMQSKCFNFTHRYITNFWPMSRLKKDDFKEHCLFYVVPLNHKNRIDDFKLGNTLYNTSINDFRPNDIVKINVHYRSYGDHLRTFIVKAVHNDMHPGSEIPGGRGETFYERAISRYGDDVVRNFEQPIIEVIPISQEIARLSQGRRVATDYQTNSIFFIRQFLDLFACDIPTAMQAYNLPEIVYKIYLTTLAGELNNKFIRATIDHRRDLTIRPPRELLEYNREENASPDSQDGSVGDEDENDDNNDSDNDESGQVQPMVVSNDDDVPADFNDENAMEDDDEEMDELNYSSSETDDYDSDDDSTGTRPANQYRDILCRQRFNLSSRGDYNDIEKWNLEHYNVPDLRTLKFTETEFQASQKYINTSPRFESTFQDLELYTGYHINNISSKLRQFRTGILGNSEFPGEDQVCARPGIIVDPSLEPPVKFDRVCKPFREAPCELHFVEALTQRRAGESKNLEALENVGDSYLKYCVTVVLFKSIDHNEGILTSARSRLTGNKYFNYLAKKNKLGCYAIGKKFDPSLLASAMGGPSPVENVMRPKELADIFESIVGACLVYRGEFEAVMAMKWLGLDIFRSDTFAELHESAVVFEKPQVAWNDPDSATRERLRQCQDRVKRFQQIVKYNFVDRTHLVQAFTHATAPQRCTDSYERLEFLGDAILDFLVTMTLYKAGYTTDPGQITSSRSAIVNNCAFARLAIKYKYDIFLQHTNQELYEELNKVNECAKSDQTMAFLDDFKFDRVTKILADLFESVAGAIYIDSGCSLDTVYGVYYPMMKETIDAEIKNPTKNIMAQLHELFPGKDRIKFEFFKTESSIDDVEIALTCAKLTIFGLEPVCGEGLSKHQAKMRAVTEALSRLPDPEEKARLDEEYLRIMREKAGPSVGRRGGRNGRGQGMRGHRGSSNFSRRDQQPYPQRGYRNYSRGRRCNRYMR